MKMVCLEDLESINKQHAANRVSDKYSFIPTTRILETLNDNGWYPVQANEIKVRKAERDGYQKHLIRLRNDMFQAKGFDSLAPEIVLTNSHDGYASFQLMAGIFRFVCSNGLIVADSLVANHRIRHQGYTEEVVKEAIYNIVEDTPKIFNKIEEFKDIKLTVDEQRLYGAAALDLLYDDEQLKGKVVEDTITNLLRPRRETDRDLNLWNTFNVIQEKCIKGGRFLVENKNSRYNTYSYKRTRKTKEVKSIDKNVKLNKALWRITEYFSKNKIGTTGSIASDSA